MIDVIVGWTLGNGNTNAGGLGLPYTYFNNFAYLSEQGVPIPGGTATFPLLVGEFGSVFMSLQNATNYQPNTPYVSPANIKFH
jgi:hypothetical protein